MIRNIMLVGIGSFAGGVLRYAVSLLMRGAAGTFPWATFAVNILGCLLIGLLWGWGGRTLSPQLVLLLSVGFCGGFTTFSTFSRESLALLQGGSYFLFALYAAGSVVVGILAAALGYAIAK